MVEVVGEKSSWFKENKRFLKSLGILAAILIIISLIGWKEVGNEISGIFGKPNLKVVEELCNEACEKEDSRAYCDTKRTLIYEEPVAVSHISMAPNGKGYELLRRAVKKLEGTCEEIKTGLQTVTNWRGKEETFNVAFPEINVKNCVSICE